MNAFSEKQKKTLAGALMQMHPDDRPAAIAQLEQDERSFDIYEYTPLNFHDELDNGVEVAREAVTFGAYEAQRNPNAGDFTIPEGVPLIGGAEVAPSAMAGEVVGAIPGVVAGYGIGGKVAQSAIRGSRALGAGAAIVKTPAVRRGRRAIQMAVGEALPGGLNGYIRSDGDVSKAMGIAAEWMAGGLIMEGAFKGITSAFSKVRQGLPLTPQDKGMMLHFDELMKDSSQRMVKDITMGPGDSILGDVTGEVLGTRLAQLGRGVVKEGHPHAMFKEQGESMLRETLEKSSNWSDGAKEAVIDEFRIFHTDMYENIRPGMLTMREIQDRYERFFKTINEGFDDYHAREVEATPQVKPIQNADLDGPLKIDETPIATDAGPPDMGAPELGKSPPKLTNTSVGTFRFRSDPKNPIRMTVQHTDDGGFFTAVDMEGKVHADLHLSDLDEFVPDPKQQRGAGTSGGSAGDSGQPITAKLTDDILKLHREYTDLYGERPRQFPERLAPEKVLKDMSAEKARSLRRQLQMRVAQGNNRLQQDNWESISRGDFLEARQRMYGKDRAKVYGEDTNLGWFARLFPTYSKYGLSANKPISIEVMSNLHRMEVWGKQIAEFKQMYAEALAPLGNIPLGQQMMGALPGSPGNASRMAMHTINGKKIKLARALDGEHTAILRDNPDLVEPYRAIRSMLDKLADNMGLPMGERILNYFPHIFHGSVGQFMAKDIAGDLGSRGRWLLKGSANDIPDDRFFASLLERTGAEGFELDLDAAIHAYINGAVKKPGMDEMLRRAKGLLEDLPMKNNRGTPHETRRLFKDYVKYISGQPGSGRVAMAQMWQNNRWFNKWTDNLVAYLGGEDQDMARWIKLAREGALAAETGTRKEYHVMAEKVARKYFKRLVDDANMYTKEGALKNVPGSTRLRAQLALKVDEIRRALSDPKMKPIVLSNLYGLMVVNKLGLNLSHGLVNITQTLTNTFPKLGLRMTTKGIARYVGDPEFKFSNGVTVKKALDDMGVLADTAEAQEFMSPGIGWRQEIMDQYVMAPARISERFNRGSAALGAYEQALSKGKSHGQAVEAARTMVIETQFPFNKAGVSPIMHGPLARFLLMFKSYPMHQLNFSAGLLEDAYKNRNAESAAALMKHIMPYMAMAGMGATMLKGTNLGFKTQHPINDFVDSEGIDVGLDDLAGPPADAIIKLLHLQIMDAAREVAIPAIAERASDAMEAPDVGSLMLTLAGMK